MSKAFVVRMVLWSVLMLYLICDFFVFSGPLRGELRRMFPSKEDKIATAMAEGVCAKVYNAPIYLSQVDRRVRENLWRSGRDPGKVSEAEIKTLRWVALDDLIAEALVRIKVRVNIEQARVSDAEVDAELARFTKRFDSPGQLEQAMAAQGIESREELRLRMQARLEQEKYVLSKIQSHITVDEKEARQWYEDHQKELTTPERRHVRHIFLATLDHPSDEAKGELEGHLALILSGKETFEHAAKSLSEDERSKDQGGNLGWMRRDRLPGDFAAAAFTIPANQPVLHRTKLGWHIIEVTGIKAPELLPFEKMKPEIVAAISDSRRQEAIEQYRHQLRLLNHEKVEIYRDLLGL
ncbi:MAG: peptidylprolyl isomerase [Akkermansiaceae bacterium]|nr:peptidylprolyl isomerase [Akkermansiaceae bacterium]